MTSAPLIGVCGPIGAGKSTVVRGLAAALGLHPWCERVADNPFFERYMAAPAEWALRSQLAFLLGAVEDATAARHHPPGGVLERPAQEMFGVFVRDLHDAGLLGDDELHTLRRIVELGERLAGVPDLLIVLHGEPQRLLERIRTRARPGEDAYDLADLQRLGAAYDRWAKTWDRGPVIDVDATGRDLRSSEEIERLAAAVRAVLPMPS
jgi:deoxyadenosine/deoxycytidine kinase